jgi:arylsulfatase A-like enzyme
VVWPNANIVLISIDTLRADHLGCYGYSRPTSPNLDEFSANAFVFERAYAQSHNTLVSHATMLTSLNPISHGALPKHPLSDGITTLAEVLRSRGYRTAAVTSHPPWLNQKMGFGQGFDHFVTKDAPAERINRQVLKWLRTQTDRSPQSGTAPIFLFIHYYDVHSDWRELPYEPALTAASSVSTTVTSGAAGRIVARPSSFDMRPEPTIPLSFLKTSSRG